MQRIKVNKIRCNKCGDEIESAFRHHYKECKCGSVFADGGHDYLLAMERSPVKDIEIKHLLKNALTSEVDSREVYMKGIIEGVQNSYSAMKNVGNREKTRYLKNQIPRRMIRFRKFGNNI